MNLRRTALAIFLGFAVGFAGLAGCGSTDDPVDDGNNNQGTSFSNDFALATTVLGESNTTYVSTFSDLNAPNIDLESAREYPGYATIGRTGDMFFVASGDTPKITRFTPDPETGELSEDGTLNFSNYVTEAPLYANVFANSTTAYLDQEDKGHVIWNPEEMTIEGDSRTSQVDAEVDGLSSFRAFRRGSVVRGNLVFQPFHWRGPDFYEFADTSKIVVYNADDNSVQNVIEAPCPGLDVGTKDEDGNIYFTTWVNAVSAPVLEGEENTHSRCAVKINAGETTLNESWTKNLSQWADGSPVAALRIIDGSTAVAAVLDESRVETGADADPSQITYAANWKLHRIDLEEGTTEEIPGIGYIAGGYYAFELDGRLFATLPSSDYSSTTVYELSASGPAEEKFSTQGWVYQMVNLK